MTSLQSLPRDQDPRELLDAIEQDGAAIVEGFFAADELAAINRELDAAVGTHPAGARTGAEHLRKFHGYQTKRFTRLFELSPTFCSVLDDTLVAAFADHFLLDADSGPYWLNSAQAIVRGPGEVAQAFHRDNGNWPLLNRLQKTLPQCTVSMMIALTDFTAENGATRVIPGSHRAERYDDKPDPDRAVTATMAAGSALLYVGGTLHAGGANTTADTWRRGIFLGFCLGWLVPSEASTLQYDLDMVRDLSPRAQRLLGFRGYETPDRRAGRLWNVDYEEPAEVLGLEDGER